MTPELAEMFKIISDFGIYVIFIYLFIQERARSKENNDARIKDWRFFLEVMSSLYFDKRISMEKIIPSDHLKDTP